MARDVSHTKTMVYTLRRRNHSNSCLVYWHMTSRLRIIDAFVVAVVAVASAAPSHRADAQIVRGEIAVGGGIATDQRGVRSNAVTLAPAVLLAPDPRFSVALSGSATQFESNVRAVGGAATLGMRLPLGSVFAVAGSAAGSATQTSFNASYASVDLTPTLEATLARLTLFAGAHVASGKTSLRQPTSTPGGVLGAPTTGVRDVSFSRTSAGPVFGGVVNLAGSRADQGAAISYREEHARIEGLTVTDRVVTGSLASGAIAASASGGVRDATDERAGFGSVSAAVAMGRAAALQASVGTYPSNRVTGTLGGRFASLGIVLRGSRRLDTPGAVPPLRGALAVANGATRLVISAPAARRVELAGDWNGWTPMLATRNADGKWYADVRLPRGEYRYAFRIDGQRWGVPEGVTSVDDGFGGRSALVSVR